MSVSNLIQEGKIHTDYYVDNVGILINDNQASSDHAYSSQKVEQLIGTTAQIDDVNTYADKTWSSNKINEEFLARDIDDDNISSDTPYSSQKIVDLIAVSSSSPTFFSHPYHFTRGTNNASGGFFVDEYVQIGWDGYDEIMIKQPTARNNVYARAVSYTGGTFPSNNPMILSTILQDFYQNSSTGHVEFWIQSDSDSTHPLYIVKLFLSSSSTLDYIYFTVQKHLSS